VQSFPAGSRYSRSRRRISRRLPHLEHYEKGYCTLPTAASARTCGNVAGGGALGDFTLSTAQPAPVDSAPVSLYKCLCTYAPAQATFREILCCRRLRGWSEGNWPCGVSQYIGLMVPRSPNTSSTYRPGKVAVLSVFVDSDLISCLEFYTLSDFFKKIKNKVLVHSNFIDCSLGT